MRKQISKESEKSDPQDPRFTDPQTWVSIIALSQQLTGHGVRWVPRSQQRFLMEVGLPDLIVDLDD